MLVSVSLVFSIVSSCFVIHYYNRYARMIDLKLSRQVFRNTAKIYEVSPKLVTTLAEASRSKRRLVEFKDIPKVLVDAVTAGKISASSAIMGWIPFESPVHLSRILKTPMACKAAALSPSSSPAIFF